MIEEETFLQCTQESASQIVDKWRSNIDYRTKIQQGIENIKLGKLIRKYTRGKIMKLAHKFF